MYGAAWTLDIASHGVDKLPGIDQGDGNGDRSCDSSGERRLLVEEDAEIHFLSRDLCTQATDHEVFCILLIIVGQRHEAAPDRLDGTWDEIGDNQALAHALRGIVGVAHSVASTTLQHAVKAAASSAPKITLLDQCDVQTTQIEVTCHTQPGCTAADHNHMRGRTTTRAMLLGDIETDLPLALLAPRQHQPIGNDGDERNADAGDETASGIGFRKGDIVSWPRSRVPTSAVMMSMLMPSMSV